MKFLKKVFLFLAGYVILTGLIYLGLSYFFEININIGEEEPEVGVEMPEENVDLFAVREYNVQLRRVVDGDTVRLDIFRGHGLVSENESVRLWGIDTPELKGKTREEGLKAKARLEEILQSHEVVSLQALEERDSFGRILGTIFVGGVNVNRLLLEEGHAVPYDG